MIPAIKICGVTSVADAEAAISAGAAYLGLIFAAGSPRKLPLSTACDIAQAARGRAKVVGVFKDSPAVVVTDIFAAAGLDFVQYHGNEDPAFIKSISLPAIKAVEINERFSWEKVMSYEGAVEYLLFDQPKGERDPNWLKSALAVVASAPAGVPPYFFAGGLTAENVVAVIRHLQASAQAAAPINDGLGAPTPRRHLGGPSLDVAEAKEATQKPPERLLDAESLCDGSEERAARESRATIKMLSRECVGAAGEAGGAPALPGNESPLQFYGLDVASGVEKEPGVKDIPAMIDFCKTVKEEAMRCER